MLFFRKRYPTTNFIAFFQALSLVIYVTLVGTLLANGEKVFGDVDFLMPVLMLLIFVTSALISALLVFGYPLFLFLNKQKGAAFKLVIYTAIWLVVFVITTIIYIFSI